MNKVTARNEHIDVMKGFAILLVLLGHRFMANTIEGAHHPMAIIIYSFHMAFFFFISGYVNEYTKQLERKGSKIFLLDKFRTLLLPFFVWTLICYLPNENLSIEGFVSNLNFYPEKGYWFLPVLFIFLTIYLLLNNIASKWGGGVFITVLVLISLLVRQIYPIWYASYLLSFLLGGYMADKTIEKQLTSKRVYGISTLVSISCWCFYPCEPSTMGKINNIALMFIISVTSCITFFNFFKVFSLPGFIKVYLSEIGKYTLVLYLVPILILPPHTFRLYEGLTFTSVSLIILAVAILHSFVSYSIGRIIFEIPYLRLILFGKK